MRFPQVTPFSPKTSYSLRESIKNRLPQFSPRDADSAALGRTKTFIPASVSDDWLKSENIDLVQWFSNWHISELLKEPLKIF